MTPYYQDDAVTIYHGDCREILPTLEPVDLVLTDPPYGMGDILTRSATGSRWRRHFEAGPLEWDKFAPIELTNDIVKNQMAIVWGGQFFNLPPARGWLIWNKIIRNWSSSECELAWTNIQQPNRAFDYSHGQLASEGKWYHPTQKPLPLMTWCLGFTPEAKSVLDPFMGSGTTLRAAKDLGRKAIGIEIEEKYCEIAAKRMAQEVLPL